jgi:5-formyltetrahydrofolate cyclo-ligase
MTPESLDGQDRKEGPSSSEEKAALRERMRRARASIPEAERARLSRLVEGHLLELPELGAARTVLLFYSFGTEVATGGIAAGLLASGKRLLLPFLTGGIMEAAELRPGDALEPTGYGPSEPARRVAIEPGQVDAVVAPGLAFDRLGNRLGYGGGHYDRYLARTGRRTYRAGIGFSLQLVDRIPTEPGDQRVDVVVTEGGSLDVRPVQ